MKHHLLIASLLLLPLGCSRTPSGSSSMLTGPATPAAKKSLAEAALIESNEAGEPVVMSLSGLRSQAVKLAELEAFPTLRSLTLQECSWAGDDDLQHLRHLAGIEKVVLIRTPVTDQGISHLSDVPSLRELQLIHTRVVGSGLRHLHRIELARLELHGDAITTDGLHSLAEIRTLRELVLHCPSVDLSKLTGIEPLEHLEVLDVRQCQSLNGDFIRQLQSLKSLKTFAFDAESVDDELIKQLASLTNLESLDLTNSNVSDDTLRTLLSLVNLRHLKLNGCANVSDDSLRIVAQFGGLEEIYLSHSRVRGSGLSHLAELASLREIALFAGQLDGPGRKAIREFENARADCSVAVESQ